MKNGFTLKVVPLDRVAPHEEVDPARVDRLVSRLDEAGVLLNPPVVTPATDHYVLLDGATRTEALRRRGFRDTVVQVVASGDLELRTWRHVIRGVDVDDLRRELKAVDGVELRPLVERGVARVYFVTGEPASVHPAPGVSPHAALSAFVACYLRVGRVSRSTRPDPAASAAIYPDMVALVSFSHLSLDEVTAAAEGGDRLPAGITRFVIPGRVLRLGVPLRLLADDIPLDEKQAELDRLVEDRARNGRIRHYTEPVFVLDE